MSLRFVQLLYSPSQGYSVQGVIRLKQLNVNSNRKCGHNPNMREREKESEGDKGEKLR